MSSVNKDETGRNGGKGGNKGLVIWVSVAIIVIVALIAVVIVLLINKKETGESVAPIAEVQLMPHRPRPP